MAQIPTATKTKTVIQIISVKHLKVLICILLSLGVAKGKTRVSWKSS